MIGVGIVGLGMAAKPHGLALQDLTANRKVAVRGVFARTASTREVFARTYDFPMKDSLAALVQDPKIKAVLVLTPPDARREIIAQLADAGKHILVEKPIERTTKAAQDIVELCEAKGVQLGVVFQHRFRDASKELARRLPDFGALYLVRVNVPWWRDQAYYDEPGRGTYDRDGGGVLISQAIHTLDLMLSVTGEVAQVQAMTATSKVHVMEAEDIAVAGLRFTSGAVGTVVATTAAFPGGAESLAMDFEHASIHLQSGHLTVNWHHGRIDTFGEDQKTGGGADPMDFPFTWHRDLIADFIDAVSTGRPPAITGRAGLKVHRLIDGMIESSRQGHVITLSQEGV
ncbi:MAG: Gfo/Idh/MocA family oxidoreductase [Pseudomonadota bacterium]